VHGTKKRRNWWHGSHLKQPDELPDAEKFAEAFLRGQPHKATIATTLFRDKIQQLRS
jgi:hypothetical protein